MRTRLRLTPIEAALIALAVVLALGITWGIVAPALHGLTTVAHALGG